MIPTMRRIPANFKTSIYVLTKIYLQWSKWKGLSTLDYGTQLVKCSNKIYSWMYSTYLNSMRILFYFVNLPFFVWKKKITINNIPNINLFSVMYKKLKVFLVYVDTSKWIQNNVLYCIFIYKYIQKLYTFET